MQEITIDRSKSEDLGEQNAWESRQHPLYVYLNLCINTRTRILRHETRLQRMGNNVVSARHLRCLAPCVVFLFLVTKTVERLAGKLKICQTKRSPQHDRQVNANHPSGTHSKRSTTRVRCANCNEGHNLRVFRMIFRGRLSWIRCGNVWDGLGLV